MTRRIQNQSSIRPIGNNGGAGVIPMPMTQTMQRVIAKPKDPFQDIVVDFKPLNIDWCLDCDIVRLNDEIIKYLKACKDKISDLKDLIEKLKDRYDTCLTVDEMAINKVKLENAEKQLVEFKSVSILEYRSETVDLLNKYKAIRTAIGPKIIGQTNQIPPKTLEERASIIEAFLEIAQKYRPMHVKRHVGISTLCPLCDGELVDNGINYVCNECQTIQKKAEVQTESTNEQDNPSSKRSDYESVRNYLTIVDEWRGTYPVVIPDSVIFAITNKLKKPNNFNMAQVTSYEIYAAMKELGYGSWYKHINKIRFIITGRKPFDIESFMPIITKRAQLFFEIYDDIKGEDRTNSIHGWRFLWISLKNEGAQIFAEDFCLLKSRDCEVRDLDTINRGFEVLKKRNPEMSWKIFQMP